MDVGDENKLCGQENLVDCSFGSKMIKDLTVGAFTGIHEKTSAVSEHIDSRNTSQQSRFHE